MIKLLPVAALGLALLTTGCAEVANPSGVRLIDYRVSASSQRINAVATPGFVTVDFSNERPTPARRVRFAFVGDDGRTYQVDDVGNFQPYIHESHYFAHGHVRAGTPVQIVYVQFADGREWASEDLPTLQAMK